MNRYQLNKCLFLIALAILSSSSVFAQDDLLGSLGDEKAPRVFERNAFKSTRVITAQSIEQLSKGVLDFRILHRFGRVNSGAYDAFGFDQATIRLALDYGITDRLTVGIGRSSNKKEIDGFIKYRPIWQSNDGWPFSLVITSGFVKDGMKWADPSRENYYSSRFSYFHQVLIGRKFSDAFSLQLMPTVVHRNLVATEADENDIISVGVGTRLKLSNRLAVTVEYFRHITDLPTGYYDPLSIGFDIETGGHVFQLHFTNSLGMNERSYLVGTDGQWSKGDIHFGFNISRVFTISKPKEFRKKKD
jgi:Membrane bound beta barrel domain (DUF5777)